MTIPGLSRRTLLFSGLALAVSSTVSACGPRPAGAIELPMAPMSGMPSDVRSAPVSVQQAYQFAVANPEVLQSIPCYCGCGVMGHTSSYDCYVADQVSDGTFRFEDHALGCSICVDIVHDTMRMLREGKDLHQVRTAIDQTYSRYGPSNMP